MRLKGVRTELGLEEEGFPHALTQIHEVPKKLYLIGNPAALQEGLAVVGARKATPYGLGCAQRFSRLAAEKGVVIISGGARGCDAAAHKAALEAGTPTVVFLGGGCDEIYPAEHHSLFQRIVDAGGAIVSEYPWSHTPKPWMFRMRNRLIAGLAKAVLIVEAGLPSGTFSTADEALSSNRDVLVVPGAITSESSRGANRLLYQGAHPVVDDDSFSDALYALFGCLKHPPNPLLEKEQQAKVEAASDNLLLQALQAEPLSMDELYSLALSWSVGGDTRVWLMEELVKAECAGSIARYPNGRWGPKG